MRPIHFTRVTQDFANSGGYASVADAHGPAGHHTGIDFGMQLLPIPIPALGQRVRSVTPGEVVISEYNTWAGNWVGVYDPDRNLTVTYWHGLTGTRRIKVGAHVEVGKTLMRVGSTGNSTAPHLHVQVNPGRGFNYHGHVDPKVARGVWFGTWRKQQEQERRRRKRR